MREEVSEASPPSDVHTSSLLFACCWLLASVSAVVYYTVGGGAMQLSLAAQGTGQWPDRPAVEAADPARTSVPVQSAAAATVKASTAVPAVRPSSAAPAKTQAKAPRLDPPPAQAAAPAASAPVPAPVAGSSTADLVQPAAAGLGHWEGAPLPWRQLSHGRSLNLVAFIPADNDPPNPPFEVPFNELEHHRRGEGPVRSEKVVWVHLHNFGGTLICEKAKMQGELISTKNCNWPGDGVVGRGWGKPYAHLAKCKERAASEKLSFSMIERGLVQGDLGCDGVMTGVMLRDPFKGARSTVLYHGFQRQVDAILANIAEKRAAEDFGGHKGLPGTFNYQFFDNMATRVLCGDFNSAPGTVTREKLEQAKEVLKRIDVILILEDLSQHTLQLEKLFRWRSFGTSAKKVNGHTEEQYRSAVTPEQEIRFKSLNVLDYELYEFAKSLAANRTEFAKQL